MTRQQRLTRRTFIVGTLGALVAACTDPSEEPDDIVVEPPPSETASTTATPATAPVHTETATPTPQPEPTLVQVEDPAIPAPVPGQQDVSLLVVLDKERPLPHPYVPPGLTWISGDWLVPGYGGLLLRADALDAYGQMREAALADGIDFRVRSAYRSYDEQVYTFDYWIGFYGSEAEARRWSAPPGHSEHQLGTTVDVSSADVGWELEQWFADTPAAAWLVERSAEFGFALSYPSDGEPVTGYVFEPWHFRYIGMNAARAWRDSGLILVQFLEGQ